MLAIGTVIVISLCMWLRFAIQNVWVMSHMPEPLREEFVVLRQHPEKDILRYHHIIDTWWGISFSDLSVASADWILVGVLVVVTIPFIVIIGLRTARPLSVQFSHLTSAAEAVTRGEFGKQAKLVENAPAEMAYFARDFNAMTLQLARYEHELHASHVAMAHELRSPLTAAMGRLQGMLDGVFQAEPHQLNMVMVQLKSLNHLIEDLHILSLVDAGQLIIDNQILSLTELLHERASWLKPQAEAVGMTFNIHAEDTCLYVGDALRLGQVFTIIMENALRYACDGQQLDVTIHDAIDHYDITFLDYGPGVSDTFLPEIFERFTRADSSRARHSGGSGLGLSLAQAMCVAHGGSIHASLPDTQGLCITMHLPKLHPIN